MERTAKLQRTFRFLSSRCFKPILNEYAALLTKKLDISPRRVILWGHQLTHYPLTTLERYSVPFSWIHNPLRELSESARLAALERQTHLTKPKGSLGQLEELAVRLAAMQDAPIPSADPARIVVFAADHGIAQAEVSAYPQSVTGQMIRNFTSGGAAISVLSRRLGAELEVVDMGVLEDPGPMPGLTNRRIGSGSRDFRKTPAMNHSELADALRAGQDTVLRARHDGMRVFIGGEMGIGNTTSAAAILCALLGIPPETVAGPGTGIDEKGMVRKARAIQDGLDHHVLDLKSPLEILRILGGYEIAALTGAYIACAQEGMTAIVDGFICGAAALVAQTIRPQLREWLIYSHRSSEPGHLPILRALNATPLLQLDMRLGEASGGAVALSLVQMACDLHRDMATFQDAGVSGKE
ncbi:MAG: nicotinate-nucleotide--dimethylbenzimidazole phosphoribosyltransferase [Magnetococcales bacterium]|nr:nicotinate-nucleotide--dimethylbenzimidazole phosphoribosyltransferase [Magnetococcales bacterium]